jgi:hypothetical protein
VSRLGLARFFEQRGQLDEVRDLYLANVEDGDTSYGTLDGLVQVCQKRGRTDLAASVLRETGLYRQPSARPDDLLGNGPQRPHRERQRADPGLSGPLADARGEDRGGRAQGFPEHVSRVSTSGEADKPVQAGNSPTVAQSTVNQSSSAATGKVDAPQHDTGRHSERTSVFGTAISRL